MHDRKWMWYVGAAGVLVAAAAFWQFWRVPELAELRELAAAGKWKKAEAGLNRYLGRNPDDSRALLLLAEVRRELDDYAGAIEALQRVPDGSALKREQPLPRANCIGPSNAALGRSSAGKRPSKRSSRYRVPRRLTHLPSWLCGRWAGSATCICFSFAMTKHANCFG